MTLHGDREKLPHEWKKVINALLDKGQSSKDECNDYRGVSLLSMLGKI